MHEKLHEAQDYDYDCGISIVRSVLIHFNKEIYSRKELMSLLGTTEKNGTVSTEIARFLQEKGLKVKINENSSIDQLRNKVNSGKICVVMFQNWDKDPLDENLEYGHYAFVDLVSDTVLRTIDSAIDADKGYGYGKWEYDIAEFERFWIDKENGRIIKRCFISISE